MIIRRPMPTATSELKDDHEHGLPGLSAATSKGHLSGLVLLWSRHKFWL